MVFEFVKHIKDFIKKSIERIGIYSFFVCLILFTQLNWAKRHNDFTDIELRLFLGFLAGVIISYGVAKILQKKFPQTIGSHKSLNNFSIILSPGVLFLFASWNIVFLSVGLALCILIALYIWLKNKDWIKKIISILSYILFLFILMFFTGEVFLRIVYHDGGAATCQGPGDKRIQYTYNKLGFRGPRTKGPKQKGVKRILVQGDSITWGTCVKEWKDLYPQELLELLNQGQNRYQMDVYARPAREIDAHLRILHRVAKKKNPDIIIYQWFINDIEIDKSSRPGSASAFWRKFSFHRYLRRRSYLWFFLNNRFEAFAPLLNLKRSYHDYLKNDFAYGTSNWTRFEIMFREWLREATDIADQTIILLYPSLPYHGLRGKKYPLQRLHDRVTEITRSRYLKLPAYTMSMMVGDNKTDNTSVYGTVRKAEHGKTKRGAVVYGPFMKLKRGDYLASFRMKLDGATPDVVATLDVVAENNRVILAKKEVLGSDFEKQFTWKFFALPFTINRDEANKVEFRVSYAGLGNLTVDQIIIKLPPLKNKIKTIDLTKYLKNMHTHSSLFDAHPNKNVHRKMANILFEEIKHGFG